MILLTVYLAERILIDALTKYLSTRKQPLPFGLFAARGMSKYHACFLVFVWGGEGLNGNQVGEDIGFSEVSQSHQSMTSKQFCNGLINTNISVHQFHYFKKNDCSAVIVFTPLHANTKS